MNIDQILTKGILPDALIRFGIRGLLKQRLNQETRNTNEDQQNAFMELVGKLRQSTLAVNTDDANNQHYEVPTEFYKYSLGNNLKYSCAYWDEKTVSLDMAEEGMLSLTCERAGIKNGEEVLELGCGWGSLSLYMAKLFPDCKITSVSNSRSQKDYIDSEIARRGLRNINIITADINHFTTGKRFDRIVSVEMFEHVRNYELLFSKIYSFLKPGGELFTHIFVHSKFDYLFEVKDESDWMTKYFFSGGIMPSNQLLLYFAKNFEILNHWIVNGIHYEKTANAWLKNMDKNKKGILDIFAKVYGEQNKIKWWVNWRVFFMSCAELWGYNEGNEWFVSHYKFKKCAVVELESKNELIKRNS